MIIGTQSTLIFGGGYERVGTPLSLPLPHCLGLISYVLLHCGPLGRWSLLDLMSDELLYLLQIKVGLVFRCELQQVFQTCWGQRLLKW